MVLTGTPLKTGAIVSRRVIVCVAVLTFPQLSIAVKVRVIIVVPAQFPGTEESDLVTVALPQLSVAVAFVTGI